MKSFRLYRGDKDYMSQISNSLLKSLLKGLSKLPVEDKGGEYYIKKKDVENMLSNRIKKFF